MLRYCADESGPHGGFWLAFHRPTESVCPAWYEWSMGKVHSSITRSRLCMGRVELYHMPRPYALYVLNRRVEVYPSRTAQLVLDRKLQKCNSRRSHCGIPGPHSPRVIARSRLRPTRSSGGTPAQKAAALLRKPIACDRVRVVARIRKNVHRPVMEG